MATLDSKVLAVAGAMRDRFCYLHDRWLDESEYEDFEEYAAVMAKEVAASGGKFIKATKRPFGCQFKIGGSVYRVKVTTTEFLMEEVR